MCVCVCVCVWVNGCGCVWACGLGVCMGGCVGGCGLDALFLFMTVLKCCLIGIHRHEYFIGKTKR